uniref:Uncharacterized protein n=1 Tax=Otolemur garnettii TaxID=30611 RepID=H0XYR7_OTOGA
PIMANKEAQSQLWEDLLVLRKEYELENKELKAVVSGSGVISAGSNKNNGKF